jgi:hypothetical protein
MRTCLSCARLIYQEAEDGDRLSAPTWPKFACARDRYSLTLDGGARLDHIRASLEAAETCDQYYDTTQRR